MSGSDIAAWFCLCGLVMDGEQPVLVDGTPDVRFFLIPAAQVEVLDTWSDVQGLRGSGSNAVQVVPTVVPSDQVVSLADPPVRGGTGAGLSLSW